MVGAKQFAIRRKIIAPKEENPLIKGMLAPVITRTEQSFKENSGSLLDRLQPQRMAQKKKTFENHNCNIVPSLANILQALSLSSFQEPLEIELHNNEDTEKNMYIPEELINRVTYAVFKNFRKYLNSDMGMNESATKHIKIDISL